MKKFFKGLLWIISIIILIFCVLIIYRLATGKEIDFSLNGITNSSTAVTTSEIPSETAGGNDDNVQYNCYKVTVSESKYFTADGELTLNEIIDEISLHENCTVEITDDNATLKAYNELTERLDEISVPYIEDGELHE